MTEPRRHLFLDLEDTIIAPVMEGWFRTYLVNVNKVKAVIAEFQPHAIHLFSFAIHNKLELDLFNQGTRTMIEEALGRKLSACPTVDDDIIPVCAKVLGIHYERLDFQDLCDFLGKHEAFRLNMRNMWGKGSSPVELLFLDDAVYNESFEWPDLQVKGRILNIDSMKEPDGSASDGTMSVPNSRLCNGQATTW